MIANAPFRSLKSGMTTTELAILLCIFWGIVAFLLFAPHPHRGSDRSANIMNIRNCQQAMRGHANMHGLDAGAPFTRKELEEYMPYPSAVNDALGPYTNRVEITPKLTEPASNWDHIWLIPGPAGLPGGKFGHNSYEDVTDW